MTAWAAEERTRLQPVQPHRADQFAKILAELPQYASNEWDAFNERALLPLLRRLKEGSIGRKPREPGEESEYIKAQKKITRRLKRGQKGHWKAGCPNGLDDDEGMHVTDADVHSTDSCRS